MNETEKLEKVEKLREKAGVSYEDAKQALEQNNWDILDAMVALEKAGKVKGPQEQTFSTDTPVPNQYNQQYQQYQEQYSSQSQKKSFGEYVGEFFSWCGKVIGKGNRNYVSVDKEGQAPIKIPITVLVILLFFAFYVVFPLMIIGLFFGFRYSLQGPDMHSNNTVNEFMDKASDTAENVKNDFKKGYENDGK